MSQGAFTDFETVQECPLCSGKKFAPFGLPNICKCPECGFYFSSPRPTQDDIARSYNSGATYERWSQSVENHKRQFRVRLSRILPYATSGKILDVGAGTGLFLGEAAAVGFTCEGTELSDPGVQISHKCGFPMHQGQLTDIDFGSLQFDVISMWHVLEHVPNPGEVLKKVFNLLPPGGIFAVAVPNETKPLIKQRLGYHQGDIPVWHHNWGQEIHLNHFLPGVLRKALVKTGFEVLDFGMDDVYPDQKLRTRAIIAIHNMSATLFQWHFGQAMYFVSRRPL